MRLNVELTKELYEETARHAGTEGRSLSDVVRVLLIEWCAKKRKDQEEREMFFTRENGEKNGY